MHFSRRLLIVPFMLGLILSFAATSIGAPSASAQAVQYGTLTGCLPVGTVASCIVNVNAAGPVQAMLTTAGTWGNGCISTSTTITVTCSVDSTGTMITISCSGGCPPNTAVQVIVNGATATPTVTFALAGGTTTTYAAPTTYSAPAYTSTAPVGAITVGAQQPTLQVTVSNPQPTLAYSTGYTGGGQCVNGSYPTALGCTSGYVPYYQPITYAANSCVGIWGGCAGGCSGITWGCFNNTSNCFSLTFCNGFNSGNCFSFSFCNGFNNSNCFSFSFCGGFGFGNNGFNRFNHGVTCPTGTTFHRTLNAAGQNCY
jgi:hypothetical protein